MSTVLFHPTHRLVERDGVLYIPCEKNEFNAPDGFAMCMHIYDAGDCDVCEWGKNGENFKPARLGHCIFDFVEMGVIPEQHGEFVILLPDGTAFDYLDHVS